jgi:uncharacterized protein YlxW (UPF0749 family)
MRKASSQISVAIVCCILGFMVAYQFKMLTRQNTNITLSKNSADITVEIEQYKQQKEELEKKVNEMQNQLKNYENAAAGRSETSKALLKELEDTRILMGSTDVQGEGVVIYLTPDNGFLSNSNIERITDRHLVYLINELRFAGAEAISINDIRITGNSGIRNSGNYIIVDGDEKISPNSRVAIKAIGDKNLLYSDLSFPEVFADFKGICDVKFEKSDTIKIGKYNKTYKLNFAKPVK